MAQTTCRRQWGAAATCSLPPPQSTSYGKEPEWAAECPEEAERTECMQLWAEEAT